MNDSIYNLILKPFERSDSNPYVLYKTDCIPSRLWQTNFLLAFCTKVILAIMTILIYSCGTTIENVQYEGCSKIRCVNINIIFDYMVNNNPEAKALRDRINQYHESINELNIDLDKIKNEEKKKLIIDKREKINLQLNKIKGDEDYYKGIILNEIDRAIINIAKKRRIDFIINIGEGAIFSKKEYDLTEDVIREIVRFKKRNAPVSR
ncbi:MAG: OmpH family outer membrane protein [Spirochaetota bacterium]|nr:OmpH family outer membrane protein [Spirochaetota bacterium]